jgi:hypothetical protein
MHAALVKEQPAHEDCASFFSRWQNMQKLATLVWLLWREKHEHRMYM